jgi:hypothetical protein
MKDTLGVDLQCDHRGGFSLIIPLTLNRLKLVISRFSWHSM